MNILVCTLGQSWAVIPEVFALLDPQRCPLYRHHPQRPAIDRLIREHGLRPVDELWVCTTDGEEIDQGIDQLLEWRSRLAAELVLRIWRTAEVSDVGSQIEGDQVRELIFRAVLKASESTRHNGRLYLSLAGGRKTMSADLQRAGMVIGCDALLHVIAPPFRAMSARMQQAQPALFTAPLPAAECAGVLPLVVGRGMRSELLDIRTDRQPGISGQLFPLPHAADGMPLVWSGFQGNSLPAEIDSREREGSRLLGNYLQQLGSGERHENWRSLYRLPPLQIERLRQERLSRDHLPLLQTLPKADLHRHIGGCLDTAAQRRVAAAIWASLNATEQAAALDNVAQLLKQREWHWDWPQQLKERGERSHNIAALLREADDGQLEHNLYGVTLPRKGLKSRPPHHFAFYDRPGELSGSALLTHPAALEPYMHTLLRAASDEGLTYLELRGSPQKYRREPAQQLRFLGQLQAVAREFPALNLRFLVIADRTRPDTIAPTVALAVKARETLDGFVVGLDLAGDETRDGADTPDEVAASFRPAFAACMPVTIHAGEGTPAERIWQAAYLLHADRIGHGLTLGDKPELMQRFRDRGICLELNPTSNDEVVGYAPGTYPLEDYWRNGLPLAICTDNPAISRTSSATEYLKASSLCRSPLTLWECLGILKQGFLHAFLPSSEREQLLKKMDHLVYTRMLEYLQTD